MDARQLADDLEQELAAAGLTLREAAKHLPDEDRDRILRAARR